MMKKTLIWMIAAMLLLAFSACQAVPDEGVVISDEAFAAEDEKPVVKDEEFAVKADAERMVERAMDDTAGTKASKLEAPEENYTFLATAMAMDGKLTITADAPVRTPEAENIPIARVSGTGWTQAQVTGFFNYLFPDGDAVTGYNVPGVMTKGKIEEMIAWYEEQIAAGTVEENTLYSEAELKGEIRNLWKQHESAPDTQPELDVQSSDGTLEMIISGGDKYAGDELLELDAGIQGERRMYVSMPVDADTNHESYLGYHRDGHPEFDEADAVRVDESNWADVAQGKLEISYNDAKKLCDDFFAAGDMPDAALSDAYMLNGKIRTYADDPGTDSYAYQFYYVRTVGEVPAAKILASGGRGDENTIAWNYENIIFWVSDKGIESISWHANTAAGEIINEDTGIIGFEEAQEIFETMVVTTFAESEVWNMNTGALDVDINGIELALVRVREQGLSSKNGIYTPAWVFYGNVLQETKGISISYGWNININFPVQNEALLIINAVDGSIIDLQKGY